MIKAEIIADSISPSGCRITSWVLEYPRFIHAEIMTHRVFSRNAASSRAIPTEKIIQQIIDNPAMPVWWGKNQSGMQAKEELDDIISVERKEYDFHMTDKEFAKFQWIYARDKAINTARSLNKLGLHKQIANRILEPWFNIRIILTGTEFENFFALRAHPDAQPEFQALAYKMLALYNENEPKRLKSGEWHIPFGDNIDENRLSGIESYPPYKRAFAYDATEEYINRVVLAEKKCKVAIARCARVSYLNFEGKDDYEADIKLCDRLFGNVPRHLSPTEHVAQCQDNDQFIGNFRGWKQYRFFFDDQNLTDKRVIKK